MSMWKWIVGEKEGVMGIQIGRSNLKTSLVEIKIEKREWKLYLSFAFTVFEMKIDNFHISVSAI